MRNTSGIQIIAIAINPYILGREVVSVKALVFKYLLACLNQIKVSLSMKQLLSPQHMQ